jgi:opacity protein-like surface antigen
MFIALEEDLMQKLIFIALFIACCASRTLAQTPEENPKNEFFAGYSYQSADINTLTIDPGRIGQNGINLEYTRNITESIGITGDISAHFHRDSIRTGAGEFTRKREQYYFLGGIKFKARNSSRIRPFAHALFGASLFRGFTSDIRTSGNVFTIDDETSFAMALGGGLDLRVNKRIDLRVIQVDYSPTFFGSGRQDNFRLCVGVVFKR